MGGAPAVGAQIAKCFNHLGWDVVTNRARGGSPPSPAKVAEFLQKTSQAIGAQLATPEPKPDQEPEPAPEPTAPAQEELFREDDDWGGDDFAVRLHTSMVAECSARRMVDH